MITLPEKFLENMKALLGEEYPAYLQCFQEESYTALRVNTQKLTRERFCEISPFALEDVSWTAKGFYYDAKKDNPAKHPYYFAGLYYIQEPSAMIPASILPVSPGDKVLDLCAAPGGKATELAAKLEGQGLLVANDISVSRAMALAKNLQIAGTKNAVVTAETPENLATHLGEFFDKILIDAPCSGEGMFRRDPHMVKDWLEKGPEYYAPIQRQILESAWKMLKPGGKLVYSTCTFASMEDEAMIQWFIDTYPDMKICPVERKEGFSEGRPELVEGGAESLKECVRIFPHRTKGEGHFAVLLEKEGAIKEAFQENMQFEENIKKKSRKEVTKKKSSGKNKKSDTASAMAFQKEEEEFMKEVLGLQGQVQRHKDTIFLISSDMKALQGVRTIFSGLLLGELKKKRFEPGTQLALAMTKEEYPRVLDLSAQDIQVIKYLKGETVITDSKEKGFVLLCVDGFPLGWCKGNGQGNMKNKYYPGWRMQ